MLTKPRMCSLRSRDLIFRIFGPSTTHQAVGQAAGPATPWHQTAGTFFVKRCLWISLCVQCQEQNGYHSFATASNLHVPRKVQVNDLHVPLIAAVWVGRDGMMMVHVYELDLFFFFSFLFFFSFFFLLRQMLRIESGIYLKKRRKANLIGWCCMSTRVADESKLRERCRHFRSRELIEWFTWRVMGWIKWT